MAVKRRTIWLSDEQWAQVNALAKDRGQTISAWMGDAIGWMEIGQTTPPDAVIVHGKAIGGTPFNSRPPFTPAPKTKGK